jgi:splicing factor 3A subunit 3
MMACDCVAVWNKIKNSKESERWKADQEEEYEDSQGNILDRKTFDLLKKQGVL